MTDTRSLEAELRAELETTQDFEAYPLTVVGVERLIADSGDYLDDWYAERGITTERRRRRDEIVALKAEIDGLRSRPSEVEKERDEAQSFLAGAREALEAIRDHSISEIGESRDALDRIIDANRACAREAVIAMQGGGIRLIDGNITIPCTARGKTQGSGE